MLEENQILKLLAECSFKTSRSGGKGGQNVNKVETKVEIEFDVEASNTLTLMQKEIILSKYPSFVNGNLIKLVSSKHRSQLKNKQETENKLVDLLNKLLKPKIKRIATKPSVASKKKKVEAKKNQSLKKELRKKIV